MVMYDNNTSHRITTTELIRYTNRNGLKKIINHNTFEIQR